MLGRLAKIRTERVAFHVTQNRQQVFVLFDRKRLESPLVQVSRAFRVVMRVPAHRMRVREPPEKIGYVEFCCRPDHKMPMIGHHAIREDGQRYTLEGFPQHSLERLVVFWFLEQRKSRDRAVQDVKANTVWTNAWSTWHRHTIAPPDILENNCVPFPDLIWGPVVGLVTVLKVDQFDAAYYIMQFGDGRLDAPECLTIDAETTTWPVRQPIAKR